MPRAQTSTKKKTTQAKARKNFKVAITQTILQLNDFSTLKEFCNKIDKDELRENLQSEIGYKNPPLKKDDATQAIDRLNDIFNHIGCIITSAHQLDSDAINDQSFEQTQTKNDLASKSTLSEEQSYLVIYLLDIYRQIWLNLHPPKSTTVQKRHTKRSSRYPVSLTEHEGSDTNDDEAECNDTFYELCSGVTCLSEIILTSWLQIEDLEFQWQCGRLFDFISSTFAAQRIKYGGAYVLHLFLKLFSQGVSGVDIQRLFKVRDILTLIDFDSSDSDCVRNHLIRSFSSSQFLQNDTGRRFLSFSLGSLQPELSVEIIEWLKTVIPNTQLSSPMLKSLSVVLHGAWRLSKGGIQLSLERCIEDLIELAILCEPKTAAKIREVLVEFYRKSDSMTSDFGCRIFSPLLYRFIPVACWKVRFNATALFAVVFPLVDVTLPSGEYEAEVERQYSTLAKLVLDSHPEVRRVAVQGVCRVLVSYWEMIPLDKITLLLDSLLFKAARDKSSPPVRAAVLDGLTLVLQNPMSHTALKSLLPNIADCIHDTSPVVRRSAAMLLQKISQVKDFELTSVVALDGILSRLIKDKLLSQLEFTTNKLKQTQPISSCGKQKKCAKGSTCDAYISATVLSELMFDSILGFEELPKQVERLLWMTEKFPLALLVIVELTASRLEALDRIRLAVALFNIACRKTLDVSQIDINENEDQPRRHKKHGTIAKVVFSVVALLLGSCEKDPLLNQEELILKRTKVKNQQESSSTIQRHTRPQLTEELGNFLRTNLATEQLTVLLEPESHVLADVIRLLSSIPVQITNMPSLKDTIIKILDFHLVRQLIVKFKNEEADGLQLYESITTFVDFKIAGDTPNVDINLLLECLSSRCFDDNLLPSIIHEYWVIPILHFCREFRILCGLQPLKDTADENDIGSNNVGPGVEKPKPAKRQKRTLKGKQSRIVSAALMLSSEGLNAADVMPLEEDGSVTWDVNTDGIRTLKGLFLIDQMLGHAKLSTLLCESQRLFPNDTLSIIITTLREFLSLLPTQLLSCFNQEITRLIVLKGEEKAQVLFSQFIELIPLVVDVSVRCSIQRSIKQFKQPSSKRSNFTPHSSVGITPYSKTVPHSIESNLPLTQQSNELTSSQPILLHLIPLQWSDFYMLNFGQIAKQWHALNNIISTSGVDNTRNICMAEMSQEVITDILRFLLPSLGVAFVFKLTKIDSIDTSSFIMNYLQLIHEVNLRTSQSTDSNRYLLKNFETVLKFMKLIAECGERFNTQLVIVNGVLTLIQLFEPLEALIFGIPLSADAVGIGQFLCTSLQLKRQKKRGPRLLLDVLEKFNSKLMKLMENTPEDFARHALIKTVLEILHTSVTQVTTKDHEGKLETEKRSVEVSEVSKSHDETHGSSKALLSALGGIDFDSIINEVVRNNENDYPHP